MPVRTWIQPPRHLLAIFLLITVVPSGLLVVSGWRLAQQDAALQFQQAQDRREQIIDVAVSTLQQALDAAARDIARAAGSEALTEHPDSVALVFSPERVAAMPAGRLLFYPRTIAGPEAPTGVFEAGESLEFRTGDHWAAARWFGRLAASSDPPVRAGAHVREARNLRRIAQTDAALAALQRAADIRGAAVAGVPADLFARWAECELLESSGRTDELRQRAAVLHADLLAGRWQLDRSLFELHLHDAAEWAGPGVAVVPAGPTALSAAAESLWRRWQQSAAADRAMSGRETIIVDGRRVTAIWQADGRELRAVLAGPDFVDTQWLGRLRPTLARQGVDISLHDSGTQPRGPNVSSRPSSETGLPWSVAVTTMDAADARSAAAVRQRLWLGGLAVLAIVVLTGTAVVARSAARELAVARLQADFVAAVSHEFRTPLTSLRQLTEVLREGRVASEERRATYYDALARQTERLQQLVETLLDFGRMEAGTSPYRREPLDAAAWVRSVVEQFRTDAAAQGHRIELEVEADEVPVNGDRQALMNALWNLLDNAVKYSPDGRTVWVRVQRDGAQLSVHVRDEGLGIPAAEQRDIFRKFVRGTEARQRNIRGTGIGLAMVAHIARAHGGEIRVESAPGRGSTFTLVIPCHAS